MNTWKLKSRIDSLNEGDANTKFFHSYASARRNSKSIWALRNHDDDLIEDENKLKEMGAQHFSDLFAGDGNTNIEAQLKVVRFFPSFVQDGDIELFLAKVSLCEIEDVLKGFKKDKSPGPDGWHVKFYLHFFNLVSDDILNAVEQSRVEGRVTSALNSTFITLIPKCDKPL